MTEQMYHWFSWDSHNISKRDVKTPTIIVLLIVDRGCSITLPFPGIDHSHGLGIKIGVGLPHSHTDL